MYDFKHILYNFKKNFEKKKILKEKNNFYGDGSAVPAVHKVTGLLINDGLSSSVTITCKEFPVIGTSSHLHPVGVVLGPHCNCHLCPRELPPPVNLLSLPSESYISINKCKQMTLNVICAYPNRLSQVLYFLIITCV